ncbi:DUF4920 domain-containing protein [Ferrimonas lipolytica]|uniref:DUF4920 domain-containing protein n=1 Tax=Ferrimonas lipolytica TaxID=2724191 RepID=A0A6H1UG25_9GAMM|nr:DUF4920 domain-containing protein [Ferrimonas lipolytica]QIZ77579.1 DUF4920 domain-containing protein [Ferrimonas lipolytica]
MTFARKMVTAVLASALSLPTAAVDFGEPVQPELLTDVATILANADSYENRRVTIEGEVIAVCKKAGCWLEIAAKDGSNYLKVKVKDGDMVFPTSSIGKEAIVTGTVQAKRFDLAQTKKYLAHVAEEQGQPFDPASVTAAKTLYQLVPTGVTIVDQAPSPAD